MTKYEGINVVKTQLTESDSVVVRRGGGTKAGGAGGGLLMRTVAAVMAVAVMWGISATGLAPEVVTAAANAVRYDVRQDAKTEYGFIGAAGELIERLGGYIAEQLG